MIFEFNSNINVLVIGDLMIDHYIYGNCNRISPEAPVPVVEITKESYTLGGAGNVLKNLVSLGATANIISVSGEDDNAKVLFEELHSLNISPNYIIKEKNRATTTKSRVLASNHQLIRLDREHIHEIDETTSGQIINILKKQVANHSIVLISDYNKGLLSADILKKIFNLCREAGVLTLLDPKGADFSRYKGVNYIKPNKKEAIIATGITITNTETLKQACKKIQEITNCDGVVITMSEDGIASFTNNELEVVPTKVLDVIDVTGAGDTVLASIGIILASGYTLKQACDFANHAAAVVVTKLGSATATFNEVQQKFINN
ncbi:D-glycero-beta-D-manno-heptose-7-phosphate kinase [Mucilaginibacter segetis]|uniref:D-glycero-beta-D-manno-heptose-7-phosphate kinase n=1 Tax=Mucilaginibacter segetis TaxID=2793071 RepID=A0A934PY45_9SPHI|nr:D-glycero-beta-D-manno-heptose-7-phosphate kinase [Mucilaginibacter segetis]MBK0381148.1 D-glycero-beta-D-manno-heptose-7-phosphate kinase [Mucilaginibacter segetis]